MLLEWKTKLSSLPLSTSTKNLTIQYIKSTFKFAHEYYDTKNISIVLTPIKNKENKQEMQVLSLEEFNLFIAKVEHPIFKAFYETLYFTGMRRGEAIALLKNDLQDETISINKSVRRITEGVKTTKTQSSIRKVKINKTLANTLKNLQKNAGVYLFGDNEPLRPTTIRRQFDKAIKLSGVKKIRLHDLRHSHATLLINNNVNIVALH